MFSRDFIAAIRTIRAHIFFIIIIYDWQRCQ